MSGPSPADVMSMWLDYRATSPPKRMKAFARDVGVPYETLRHRFVAAKLYQPHHRGSMTDEEYTRRRRSQLRGYVKTFHKRHPGSKSQYLIAYWSKRLKLGKHENNRAVSSIVDDPTSSEPIVVH